MSAHLANCPYSKGGPMGLPFGGTSFSPRGAPNALDWRGARVSSSGSDRAYGDGKADAATEKHKWDVRLWGPPYGI